MHISIIKIDSAPAAIESKASILFIRKKSVVAKRKKMSQM
jgi:hypothetical protein